jgi:hypothetical protein
MSYLLELSLIWNFKNIAQEYDLNEFFNCSW